MKKKLKTLGALAIGVVIGLVTASLILWIVEGGDVMAKKAHTDINTAKLLTSVACTLVSLVVSVVLQFALHEVGHLVCGLATGYRFSSIRFFQYAIVKDTDGFHLRKFNIPGTGGQCILTLPADSDPARVPYFWYNAGGVTANLLLTVLSLAMLTQCSLGMIGHSFFYMLAFTGTGIAALNGIPLSLNGLSNDGRNILLLRRSMRSRRFFLRMMQVAGESAQGRRLKDMPAEWFEDVPADSPKDYFLLTNRLNYVSMLEDSGRYDEARQVFEEMAAHGNQMPALLKLESGADHILMELLTTARMDVVERLLDTPLQKYIEASRRYSPLKTAASYALALLRDHDAHRAAHLLEELEAHRNDYLMPGEYHTAKSLVAACNARNATGAADNTPAAEAGAAG